MTKFIFSNEGSQIDQALARKGLAALRQQSAAGFWPATTDEKMWQQTFLRAEQIRRQADHFVVVGIGGSSLGAKALISLAGGQMPLFWDNLDPETVGTNFKKLPDPRRTHWLWISKSGSTLETLLHLQNVSDWYQQAGLNLNQHSTVVAEEKSGPLQDWAKKNNVPLLPIPANVSGRFSVFTAAGLLPAALAKVDLKEVRRGIMAAEQDEKSIEAVVSATLASWRREEWITLFWTYGDRLRPLTAWMQQLWAESLAKKVTRHGAVAPRVSFPVCCVGSMDQHSILQQVMEGARDKWVWLLGAEQLDEVGIPFTLPLLPALNLIKGKTLDQIFVAQAEGMVRGLNEVGVSTCKWTWPKVDALHAGFALFLLELMVAALGECLDVNAFDQPGVERGKTITHEILRK